MDLAGQIADPALSPPQRAMISGHIDISDVEFATQYIPALDEALAHGDNFVLVNAKGLDTLAPAYLLGNGNLDVKTRIMVHASRPYNVQKFEEMGLRVVLNQAGGGGGGGGDRGKEKKGRGGRGRHLDRDARMTRDSDYDILWVRSEDEQRKLYGERCRERVSATELNRRRRGFIHSISNHQEGV